MIFVVEDTSDTQCTPCTTIVESDGSDVTIICTSALDSHFDVQMILVLV